TTLFRSKLENLDKVFSGVVAIAGTVSGWPGAQLGQQTPLLIRVKTAIGADFRQLRQPRNLDPPAFIFRQMQMQLVELVTGHLLDQTQGDLFAVKVAAHVVVHTTPAGSRTVDDGKQRQRKAPGRSCR